MVDGVSLPAGGKTAISVVNTGLDTPLLCLDVRPYCPLLPPNALMPAASRLASCNGLGRVNRAKVRYWAVRCMGVQIGMQTHASVIGVIVFIKIAAYARCISISSYQFNNARVAARGKAPPPQKTGLSLAAAAQAREAQ